MFSDARYYFESGHHGDRTQSADVERSRHSNGELVDCYDSKTVYVIDDNVQQYWCQEPRRVNGTIVDGEYNEGNTCFTSLLMMHEYVR
jgi:hypothetical protein